MSEKQIEARLMQGVKARGGLCLKFVSPGRPGVPDRIVITPDGRVYFVEIKTEIGRLAKIQRWILTEMQRRNAEVRVIHGAEEVMNFIEEVMPK